jgi:hypothetical protein
LKPMLAESESLPGNSAVEQCDRDFMLEDYRRHISEPLLVAIVE